MLNKWLKILPENKKVDLFYKDDKLISKDKFIFDIISYYDDIKNIQFENIALYIPNDPYLFYVLFLSSLCVGKNIILLTQINNIILSKLKEKTNVILTNSNMEIDEFHVHFPVCDKSKMFELPRIYNPKICFFTSGSTNSPKCIEKKLESLVSEVEMHSHIHANLISQEPILVSSVVPFHMYGMLWRFLFSLKNNITQDIDTIFYPEELLKKQKTHKKIIFVTTPSFMNELMIHKDNYLYAKNIIAIFSSGSMLSKQLSYMVKETLGQYPYEIYGSTEAGGIAYRQQINDDLWRVFPEVSIKVDEDSCLSVKSNFSYTNNFRTSDEIEIINDKLFILKNRKDRMVKIMEKRLSLPEMETYLNSWEYIRESYILVQTNNEKSSITAIISLTNLGKEYILKNGKSSFIIIFRNYLNKNFDSSFIPKKIKIIEKMPYNHQGKIIKSEIESIVKSKINEPIFILLNSSSNKMEAELIFDKNSSYFNGHFPNFPILPGVIQLHFAFYYLKVFFNIIPEKYEINKLKFTSLILPNNKVHFSLEIKQNEEICFSYENGDKIYSSGKISLKE